MTKAHPANRATDRIRQHTAMAIACLEHRDISRAGILSNPPSYLRALRDAGDEIDKAIAVMEATSWPNDGGTP